MDILGFKIYLLDKYNKIQCLILKRNVVQEFYEGETNFINSFNNSPSVVSSYNYFNTIKSSVVANYSIRESDKTELQIPKSNKLKPIDKNKDIIFILEGGDINNHLFTINKYGNGNGDDYNYTGSFCIDFSNWIECV
jgi:hypothetical protein